MKILISIGTLGLGGAEKQAVWLANRLSEEHEVTLLTYHGGAREKDISSSVTWKTIFDIESLGQVTIDKSTNLNTENSPIPFQSVNAVRLNLDNSIQNELDSILDISRAGRSKEKIRFLLKDFPEIYRSCIRLHIRFESFIKCLKLTLSTLNNFVYSLKSRMLTGLRKFLYLLTLPKVRVNLKNQTYVFRKARKIVKESGPDLIITFLFHDTLNVGLAGLMQIKRPRLIVGRRSPIGYGDDSRSKVHKLILKIINRFATLAVSNSFGNLESAHRDGLRENKLRVIGNYISSNTLSEISFFQDKALKILCIANFHWYKNHEGLLRAVSSIVGHQNRFHFTFVGDGPLLGDMQILASELKISAEFKGFVDNPSLDIHNYHAMVLVSHVEGSSNALLEGLVAGVPALVSNVGAVQELVKQGAPLIVCDSTDLDSIAKGLVKLSNEYQTLRSEALSFSNIVLETLGEDSVLKKWQDVIKEVTSS